MAVMPSFLMSGVQTLADRHQKRVEEGESRPLQMVALLGSAVPLSVFVRRTDYDRMPRIKRRESGWRQRRGSARNRRKDAAKMRKKKSAVERKRTGSGRRRRTSASRRRRTSAERRRKTSGDERMKTDAVGRTKIDLAIERTRGDPHLDERFRPQHDLHHPALHHLALHHPDHHRARDLRLDEGLRLAEDLRHAEDLHHEGSPRQTGEGNARVTGESVMGDPETKGEVETVEAGAAHPGNHLETQVHGRSAPAVTRESKKVKVKASAVAAAANAVAAAASDEAIAVAAAKVRAAAAPADAPREMDREVSGVAAPAKDSSLCGALQRIRLGQRPQNDQGAQRAQTRPRALIRQSLLAMVCLQSYSCRTLTSGCEA